MCCIKGVAWHQGLGEAAKSLAMESDKCSLDHSYADIFYLLFL